MTATLWNNKKASATHATEKKDKEGLTMTAMLWNNKKSISNVSNPRSSIKMNKKGSETTAMLGPIKKHQQHEQHQKKDKEG